MLSYLALSCLGLICIVLQSNPFLAHCVFPVKPDLSIPVLVAVTLSRPPVEAFLSALWLGFLVDVFSGGFLGIFIFLRGLMFFLVFFLKKRFFLESPLYTSTLVLGLFYVELVLLCGLLPLKHHPLPVWQESLTSLFWQAALSLLLWYGSQPILGRLVRWGLPILSQTTPWTLTKK
jgi:rod shape-determining protein MreD